MYNEMGYGGVRKLPNDDIVILVSSLHKLADQGMPFIFTNQHAYPQIAEYFSDLKDLGNVDWPLLQSRNFTHDPDDPGKKERYQAEALVWKYVPISALLGVCCYSEAVERQIGSEIAARGLELRTVIRKNWYF